MQRSSDCYFGRSVLALDPSHHATSRRAINYVHSALGAVSTPLRPLTEDLPEYLGDEAENRADEAIAE